MIVLIDIIIADPGRVLFVAERNPWVLIFGRKCYLEFEVVSIFSGPVDGEKKEKVIIVSVGTTPPTSLNCLEIYRTFYWRWFVRVVCFL